MYPYELSALSPNFLKRYTFSDEQI